MAAEAELILLTSILPVLGIYYALQCDAGANYWEFMQTSQVKGTVPNTTALTSTPVMTLGVPWPTMLLSN